MAIKSNTDQVVIEVSLDYNDRQAQRIAQQIGDFQRKQQQQAERHTDKLRQSQETHQQKLKQMEERANKQAEIRAKQHQDKLLKSTKTWSAKMLDSINSIRTAVIAMGVAFVSTQVIGGIKQLATEALSLAKDLQSLANQAGISTTNLQALGAVYSPLGLNTEQVADTFLELRKAIQEAGVEGGDKAEAFKQLGIAFRDSNGNARATVDVYNDIVDASKRLNLDFLVGQLDRLGGPIGDNLAKVAGSMETIAEASARTKGQIISQDSLNALNALNTALSNAGREVKVSFADSLAQASPEIEDAINRIRDALKSVNLPALIENSSKLVALMIQISPILASIGATLGVVKLAQWAIAGWLAIKKIPPEIQKISTLIPILLKQLDKLAYTGKLGFTAIWRSADRLKIKLYILRAAILRLVTIFGPWIILITAAAAALVTLYLNYSNANDEIERGNKLIKEATNITDAYIKARQPFIDSLKEEVEKQEISKLVRNNSIESLERQLESLKKTKDGILELGKEQISINRGTQESTDFFNALGVSLNNTEKQIALVTEAIKRYRENQRPARPQMDYEYSPTEPQLPENENLSELDALIYKTKQDFQKFTLETMTAQAALASFTSSGKYTREELEKIAQMLGQELPQQVMKFKDQLLVLKDGFMSLFGDLQNLWSARLGALQADLDIRNEQIRLDNEQAESELENLRRLGYANTAFYKSKEKQSKREELEETAKMKRLRREQKQFAYMSAIINTSEAVTRNLATYPMPLGGIMASMAFIQGLVQIATIKAQKFAMGGVIQGNPYQDSTQVLAQGGEYIVNQKATERNRNLLESINNGASFGGGAQVTINVAGNVIGEDKWVRDNLIPQIQKAVDQGYSLSYA